MTVAQRNALIAALIGLLGLGGWWTLKPTPAPTPTPIPVDTPVVVMPDTALHMGDDFTGYKSTAALLANVSSNAGGTGNPATVLYNDGYNAQYASLDTTVRYNGHATLKYTQPAGTGTSPALWASFKGGRSVKVLWYRAKIRFVPGFTTTGTTTAANAYKLLGWGWNTYDGSGRVEITNTTQYELYWNVQAKGTGALIGGGVFGDAGRIASEWTDGAWYDYIVECDFSRSDSGYARVWMSRDGGAPVLRATSAGAMQPGKGALPGLTAVMLGLNINQKLAASQALWYGQWEAVDGVAHPDPFKLGTH